MKIKTRVSAKTTTNNRVYNITIKRLRELNGDIYCAWCPYHKHENFTGSSYSYGRPSSWKTQRKTQYK